MDRDYVFYIVRYSVSQSTEIHPTRAVAHPHAICYKSGNPPNAVAPLAKATVYTQVLKFPLALGFVI
ncbi:hypothetical protein [Calothrix sp. 336/3]|uniref:hypothetical protein n=1 Tax=Calothrix sp. 336/3 TaxID=1337936 RepID=UPI0026B16DA0